MNNTNMPRTSPWNDALLDPIAAAFRRAESLSPGKPFLISGDAVLTYGELLDRTGRLSALFAESGLETGDRIVIATNDDKEAITFLMASLRCGIAAILIDPSAPASPANALLKESSAKGIVLDEALFERWRPDPHPFMLRIRKPTASKSLFEKLLRKKGNHENSDDYYPGILQKISPDSLGYDIPGDFDAYIMFTSGTTSRPKGVRISRHNLGRHLDTLSRQFGYDENSRILNILPLHHADGIVEGPLAAFWNRACVSRPFHFAISGIPMLLDSIYADRITHFVAVPTILAMIFKFAKGYEDCFATVDFRFVISVAAQLEEHLWESFEHRFGTRIANVYGLTETVSGGLFCGPDEESRKTGTIGKPVDCEARIVDEEGHELQDGKIGELIMRGGNIMKGYLNDPDATGSVLKEGWLYTGDLAFMDSDGFFRIAGRKKNLIITGGFNVIPEEVTGVLTAHPDVIEAVTFGMEDDTWGELVVSCAVVGSKEYGEAELVDYCRSQLPHEKVPALIHLLPSLPKGPSGKVILSEVKQMVNSDEKATGVEAADIENGILSLASQCFKVPSGALSLQSNQSNTPGWDSLAHLAFVVALEKSFGIRLEPMDIIRIESIGDAVAIADEKKRI